MFLVDDVSSGRAAHDPPAQRQRAGMHVPIGDGTFRSTSITAYLGNGGALERA